MASGEWLVGGSTLTALPGGGSRIDLEVAGHPLFFESTTAELVPRPEAWITALAISAAAIDAELVLTEPLPDPVWLNRVQDNVARCASWWGGSPQVAIRTLRPEPGPAPSDSPSPSPSPPALPSVSPSAPPSAPPSPPSPDPQPAGILHRLRSRFRRPSTPAGPTDPHGPADRPGPADPLGPTTAVDPAAPVEPATGATLQCFTGGVDSFFSLLTGDEPPTHLLYVHGFDIDLDDHERRRAVSTMLTDVANRRGLGVVEIATDLKTHPAFSSISWDRTHGAALAACGLLLAGTADHLVIPPSDAHSLEIPWGSRPDLDEAWSVPGLFEVHHGDGTGTRMDRMLAIADDPLVLRHLRVCWQNRDRHLNCGRCEKCVWATAALHALGHLDRSETFPTAPPITERLDELDTTQAKFHDIWTAVRNRSADPELRSAVDRLLERSPTDTARA